jgi:predicted nucleic acid-binding Zn ribbon protein
MDKETCIVCGETIPEGMQICAACEEAERTRRRGSVTPITREIIDAVFADVKYRRKNKRDYRLKKKACELSLTGAPYKQIAAKLGRSEYWCRKAVYLAVVYYRVFVAEEDDGKN